MTRLHCLGLKVVRGGHLILDGVDLEVESGTLTVLVGPSGAGKTTLLRAVAGLELVLRGVIRLGNRDLAGVPPHRRRIAKVFQEPRLFTNLDVLENVAFGLRAAGVGRRERQATARTLLEEVGLADRAHEHPAHLSGGEQQRVALARALAVEPELILLDEPLAAVDPNLRRDLRWLISRLHRARGITTLYVTHDRVEAVELGDRVALMLGGRIVQHDRPQEIIERPASLAAAHFFGATNTLRGTVTGSRMLLDRVPIPVPGVDGDAVFVIRPEQIRLDEASPLRLRVREGVYVGAHVRLRLEGEGLALEAEVPPEEAPPVGSEVGVVLPRRHLWRLGEETRVLDQAGGL